jgi:hypothetical protein
MPRHDCFTLERYLQPSDKTMLAAQAPIYSLRIRGAKHFGAQQARLLADIPIDTLQIDGDISRVALRYLLRIPSLRELNLTSLSPPGKVVHLPAGHTLQVLRIPFGMGDADVMALGQSVTLRVLSAHDCRLSQPTIAALAQLPALTHLDLECSNFDDRMAKRLARASQLEMLELGGTRIGRAGLAALAKLPKLKGLDLWATSLTLEDLTILRNIPGLEYLSLGHHEQLPQFDGQALTELLLSLPMLKRAWLDGPQLSPAQHAALTEALESLRT